MEEQKQPNKINFLNQDNIKQDIQKDFPEKSNKTKLLKWFIILISILIIGIVGYFCYQYYFVPNELVPCTMEVKLCPDGSGVGKFPPDCEFEECPDSTACITLYEPVCGKDGKTYSNSCFAGKDKIEIDYQGECKEEN